MKHPKRLRGWQIVKSPYRCTFLLLLLYQFFICHLAETVTFIVAYFITRSMLGIYRHSPIVGSRQLSALVGRLRRFSSDKLSRTERRALERKQRNKEKRVRAQKTDQVSGSEARQLTAPTNRILSRLQGAFHPKALGSQLPMKKEHLIATSYRLPVFLLLCFLATHEDYSPYVVQASLGPSMLPSIQFIGDLWLVQTGAWSRMFGLEPAIQCGDVILWKDPTNGRVACKRVIGVGGTTVQRYGQYAHIYAQRDDWGIMWPHNATDRGLDIECKWDTDRGHPKDIHRTLQVPEGHVWLEGDCPPFSLDSRHYGPIPTEYIRGRLLLRLWPLNREDEYGNNVPNWVSKERPTPLSSIDQYLGRHNNFYRIKKGD